MQGQHDCGLARLCRLQVASQMFLMVAASCLRLEKMLVARGREAEKQRVCHSPDDAQRNANRCLLISLPYYDCVRHYARSDFMALSMCAGDHLTQCLTVKAQEPLGHDYCNQFVHKKVSHWRSSCHQQRSEVTHPSAVSGGRVARVPFQCVARRQG